MMKTTIFTLTKDEIFENLKAEIATKFASEDTADLINLIKRAIYCPLFVEAIIDEIKEDDNRYKTVKNQFRILWLESVPSGSQYSKAIVKIAENL